MIMPTLFYERKDMVMESFISWIGGKKALRRKIVEEFPEKGTYSRYVEVLLIEVVPNKMPKTGKHLIIEEHGNRKKGKGQ